jgi:hypothetical protein
MSLLPHVPVVGVSVITTDTVTGAQFSSENAYKNFVFVD